MRYWAALFHTVVAKGNGGKRSGTSRWWRKQAAGVKSPLRKAESLTY